MVKKGRENKLGVVGFPGGASGKEFACNVGDTGKMGLIPGSGRSPRRRNGNPLQYPCLENPIDRGTWRVTVHRVAKSQMQLSTHTQGYFSSLVLPIVNIFCWNVISVLSCYCGLRSVPGCTIDTLKRTAFSSLITAKTKLIFEYEFW